MRSKLFAACYGIALLVSATVVVGCKDKAPPPPPPPGVTPERAKELIGLLSAKSNEGAFGADMKKIAAEQLGDMGQVAKDAGAMPELTKLSKNAKATKEARVAADAAIAKLNGGAAAP